jgi:catechol 2,3-dioxygenase-like lactoylglutathione lyase family enzyme
MRTSGFDHVSLPTADPDALIAFYRSLDFPILFEDDWRAGEKPFFAIVVGPDAKLNVHPPEFWQSESFTLRGPTAVPGCTDICLRFDGTVEEAQAWLAAAGAPLEAGPYEQPGGAGGGVRLGVSVYTRDPDGNLVEFMTYPDAVED